MDKAKPSATSNPASHEAGSEPCSANAAHQHVKSSSRPALERLTLIAQITNPVVGAGPLQQQVHTLLEKVCSAYAVEACVVRTLDGRDLNLLSATGVPTAQLAQQMPAYEGLARRMIEERRPLAVEDVETEAATATLASRARNDAGKFWFRAYAGAPLLVENSVVGILGIYATQHPRQFTESELNHLQIVANHIAISIVNDRLFRDLVENREELRRQIEQRERAEQERQAIELQLRHAQRMESLGHLAGGIAHDFNNLLTVILGGVDGLREGGASRITPVELEWLGHIDEAAQRATELTRQLLAFSRKQPNNPTVFDLSALTHRLHKILRRLVREEITLSSDCTPAVCPIHADMGQIEQVIINLVVNARDAIAGGGHIEVGCALATDGPAALLAPDSDPSRPCAVLWVKDDGRGIDELTVQHIFEPFFTTKAQGAGTGLGLAMVYGIVKQAGGTVTVDTSPHQGATFCVYIPTCEDEIPLTRPERSGPAETCGSERVLVCEDEPSVRHVICATLRAAGYRVLEASAADVALELVRTEPETIDLLITDMIMPGMNGRQLATKLRAAMPSLHTLLVSGYLGHAEDVAADRHPWEHSLQKPFTPQALLHRVRQVLARRS